MLGYPDNVEHRVPLPSHAIRWKSSGWPYLSMQKLLFHQTICYWRVKFWTIQNFSWTVQEPHSEAHKISIFLPFYETMGTQTLGKTALRLFKTDLVCRDSRSLYEGEVKPCILGILTPFYISWRLFQFYPKEHRICQISRNKQWNRKQWKICKSGNKSCTKKETTIYIFCDQCVWISLTLSSTFY